MSAEPQEGDSRILELRNRNQRFSEGGKDLQEAPPSTYHQYVPLNHAPGYNIQCFLNTTRVGDSITSSGSPFQHLTIPLEKKHFLTAADYTSGKKISEEGFLRILTAKPSTYLAKEKSFILPC